MTREQAKRELVEVLSEAARDVSGWVEYLDDDEVNRLMGASDVVMVKAIKQEAVVRRERIETERRKAG